MVGEVEDKEKIADEKLTSAIKETAEAILCLRRSMDELDWCEDMVNWDCFDITSNLKDSIVNAGNALAFMASWKYGEKK